MTDAFITVSIGTEQHTVRASRELGDDRLDTTVGPLVGRGDRRPAHAADPLRRERVGHRGRPHVHRHRRRARGAAHVHPPVRPGDPGRHPLRAGRRVGGHAHRRRAHLRRHARRVEGRPRPVVGRAARRRARGARHQGPPGTQDGYGFRHDWLPMQFDDHMLKVQIDQDADGHRIVEESMRVWNIDHGSARSSTSAGPRSTSTTSPAPARCAARPSRTTDPDGNDDHRARTRRCARSTSPPGRAT